MYPFWVLYQNWADIELGWEEHWECSGCHSCSDTGVANSGWSFFPLGDGLSTPMNWSSWSVPVAVDTHPLTRVERRAQLEEHTQQHFGSSPASSGADARQDR